MFIFDVENRNTYPYFYDQHSNYFLNKYNIEVQLTNRTQQQNKGVIWTVVLNKSII